MSKTTRIGTDTNSDNYHTRKPDSLIFYLNGEKVIVDDVDPRQSLLTYLHLSEVGLMGTKLGCGQGGCGSCAVMLSSWNPDTDKVEHRSINSCLRPLASLDGMAVTTIEGVGSVRTSLSPVQHMIAATNGSQCGYCTPGFVMNMQGFLAANKDRAITQKDVEKALDGNLCRCTGYRPILFGAKHFANDWEHEDAAGNMVCKVDPAKAVPVSENIFDGFPDELKIPPRKLLFKKGGYSWIRPLTLEQLCEIGSSLPRGVTPRLLVGNTSTGVYSNRGGDLYPVQIDISLISELRGITADDEGLAIGAATTFTQIIHYLKDVISALPKATEYHRPGLETMLFMAERTGGAIVRNAATLGGNLMMAAKHDNPQKWQETFIVSADPSDAGAKDAKERTKQPGLSSDFVVALLTLGCRVRFTFTDDATVKEMRLPKFIEACYENKEDWQTRVVIIAFLVPWTAEGDFVQAYKVSQREDNSRSIVNACFRVRLDNANKIIEVAAHLGGSNVIPFAAIALQTYLEGKAWTTELLPDAISTLGKDLDLALRDMPEDHFFTVEYKRQLAAGFFYKFFVAFSEKVMPGNVSPEDRSAGQRYVRPISRGTQKSPGLEPEGPLRKPYIKLESYEQSTGEAEYTHNIPMPPNGLFGHYVLSTKPLANFHFKTPTVANATPAQVEDHLKDQYPGVRALITAEDLPEGQRLPASQDPYLCHQDVTCVGQSIAVVIADSDNLASIAASYVQRNCIAYSATSEKPVFTIADAISQGSIFSDTLKHVHISRVTRPGSTFDWTKNAQATEKNMVVVDGVECAVVESSQRTAAQAHFYLETQSCVVFPQDGNTLEIHSSTQSPMSVHKAVCKVTGLPSTSVSVRIKRLGGAFGGKCSRPPYIAVSAALAAQRTNRPVKIALSRDIDTAFMGKRHPYYGESWLAIGAGTDEAQNKGRIMGRLLKAWADGGNTYDCSYQVLDCFMLKSDGPYMIANSEIQGDVCRTNKASNTAFRSFGAIQATLVLEAGIEAAAHAVGMLPEDLRRKNFNQLGDVTPYGQSLDYCYMTQVWDYFLEQCDFYERLDKIEIFNQENHWRKRGISVIPMQYAFGYNAVFLQQGGALIVVFSQDGAILLRTGGIEMGQGLATKVAQVAASALGVPLWLVNVAPFDSNVIPNPSSTGASTGSELNSGAVLKAAHKLRTRLEEFAYSLLKEHGSKWCAKKGINFWDFEDGWSHEVQGPDCTKQMIWQNLISQAYYARVDLSSEARFQQVGASEPIKNLAFKDHSQQIAQFLGQSYSASCAEVEIDVLTGESRVLRADVCYDMGESLNPAVDVGQVEGAFVQGMGNVLTEEVVYKDGSQLALNTWDYKIPACSTIPQVFNVILFPRNKVRVPHNPNLLLSSKVVGEPSFVLASSVFFAVKRAVLAARRDRGHNEYFQIDAPATPLRVRAACLVKDEDMVCELAKKPVASSESSS